MNLVIDVGNSAVKLAIFNGRQMLEKRQCAYEDFQNHLDDLLKKYPSVNASISSNVANLEIDAILEGLNDIPYLKLSADLNYPFIIKYKTPETLGVDRLALATAAFYNYPKQNVLVIDAGTCVTTDFLTEQGEYLGGSISPGLQLRYKSLHQYTARLPLLEKQQPSNYFGKSTQEAIHSGVVLGLVSEIDGAIERFAQDYRDLTVILTGGDGKFLSNQLKNSIFANSNFLLEGLNHILDFNRT